MTVPSKLYKYQPFSALTLSNLKKRVWYFAPPAVFNDPFDSQFSLHGTRASAEELELYRQAFRAGKIEHDVDINAFLDDPQRLGDFLDTNYEVVERKISGRFAKTGVCCFSSRVDSLLMWGHYADGHRGFCLEFETNTEQFRKLRRVGYHETCPPISAASVMAGVGSSALEAVMCSKPNEWAYEQEWRLFHTQAGTEYCYGAAALTGIYFGARMDLVSTELLALVLRGSTTKLYQAALRPGSYCVSFVSVDYTPHPEAGGCRAFHEGPPVK